VPRIADVPAAEKAYCTIRGDILACRLKPGERLKIDALSARLSTSPGAIREALSRLCADRLVVGEAWKGFSVAPVSSEDLDDLTRTRLTIETDCLRQSIEAGGIEWETQLVAADHRLARLTADVRRKGVYASDEWADAHAEYHQRLVDACGSAWLLRLRRVLFDHAERYRRLALTPRSGRDLDAEHRAITEAALARDVKRACRLLSDHLLLTPFMVRKYAAHALGPGFRAPATSSASRRRHLNASE
jgi:DNA-binding GntR family transcriptional regulator